MLLILLLQLLTRSQCICFSCASVLTKIQRNARHNTKSTLVGCWDHGSGRSRDEEHNGYPDSNRGSNSVLPWPVLPQSNQHSNAHTPTLWVATISLTLCIVCTIQRQRKLVQICVLTNQTLNPFLTLTLTLLLNSSHHQEVTRPKHATAKSTLKH